MSSRFGAIRMKVNPADGAQLLQMADAWCVGVGAITEVIDAVGTNLEDIQHYVLTERAGARTSSVGHGERGATSGRIADQALGQLVRNWPDDPLKELELATGRQRISRRRENEPHRAK